MGQQEIPTHITAIDRERSRLRKLLRDQDPKILNRRPPSGDWSIVENVRHLLWAEQKHLGMILPGGFEWSRVGLTVFRGRQYADVGTEPTEDIEKVFETWDEVHKPMRSAVKSAGGDVEKALAGNHSHLRIHVGIIEELLRKHDA